MKKKGHTYFDLFYFFFFPQLYQVIDSITWVLEQWFSQRCSNYQPMGALITGLQDVRFQTLEYIPLVSFYNWVFQYLGPTVFYLTSAFLKNDLVNNESACFQNIFLVYINYISRLLILTQTKNKSKKKDSFIRVIHGSSLGGCVL